MAGVRPPPRLAHDVETVLRWLRPLAYAGVVMLVVVRAGSLLLAPSSAVTAWDADVVARAVAVTNARPTLAHLLLGWQAVTEPWVLQPLVLVVAAALWTRGVRRPLSLWAALTSVTTWLLAYLAKLAVGRPRPDPSHPVEALDGLSFPSGHVTNAAAATALLVLLLWPAAPGWRRALLVGCAAALVAGTMLDRVLLGAHYPSDVLGGLVLGLGMVAAAYAGFHRLRPAR